MGVSAMTRALLLAWGFVRCRYKKFKFFLDKTYTFFRRALREHSLLGDFLRIFCNFQILTATTYSSVKYIQKIYGMWSNIKWRVFYLLWKLLKAILNISSPKSFFPKKTVTFKWKPRQGRFKSNPSKGRESISSWYFGLLIIQYIRDFSK